MDEDDWAILERQISRYLAATDDQRRFDDALARGWRVNELEEMMKPLLESGEPAKYQAAGRFIAEHLRRERGK